MAAKKRWPRFNPTEVNIDYMQLVHIKVAAMKKLLHDWGLRLKQALRQESNLDSRAKLYQAISFKVETKSTNELTAKIRLLVGILDRKSPVLKYLKFYTFGNRRHFVPVYYGGRSTGILTWAKDRGITVRKGRKWVWAKGAYAGMPFTGLPAKNDGNNFFNRVYQKYNTQIRRDINQILGSAS